MWSRLLTYFGFDAVRAERAVARMRSTWGAGPRSLRIPRWRPGPVPAAVRYVGAGALTLTLVALVLVTAGSITRIVADSDPRQRPEQAERADVAPSATQAQPVVESAPPLAGPPATQDISTGKPSGNQTPAPVAPVPTPLPATVAAPAVTAPTTSGPVPPTVTPQQLPAATNSVSVAAPLPTPTCTAVYRTVDAWPGGFVAQIEVTAESLAVTTWTVSWRARRVEVTDSWNATLTSGDGTLSATPASYGGRLDAGASLEFGFVASGDTRGGDQTVDCVAT